MAKKKSILFYLDNYTESMKGLSFEQKGMLFDAIVSYGGGIADMPEEMGLLSLAFDPIKATMDRDQEKYEQVCERNRKNGLKGGKPKQTQANPLGSSGLDSEPTGTQVNPNKPDKDTDTIQIRYDTDTEQEEQKPLAPSEPEPEKKKAPRKVFKPPTVEEVAAYCTERKNTVDPEAFVNFYESKGWLVGKNKMKSWNAAVRTWEKNSFGSCKNKISKIKKVDYGKAGPF